jgi:hypothetical protein
MVETPEGNLVAGMKWLQKTYTFLFVVETGAAFSFRFAHRALIAAAIFARA